MAGDCTPCYNHESYPATIQSLDRYGNEVSKVVFAYELLPSVERAELEYSSNESKSDQRLYELFRLEQVHVYENSQFRRRYVLEDEDIDVTYGTKRLLKDIKINFNLANKSLQTTKGWSF